MQRLAGEMNLSETAFVWPEGEAYGLRWFTPETEVDLCGHATLATAHVLFDRGRVDEDGEAVFETAGGRLVCEHDDPWLRMRFPADAPQEREEAREDVALAIDAKPTWVGASERDLFAVVDDETAVRQLEPDLDAIAELDARGLIVTAGVDDETEVDFVSRFFAPGAGVPEDPVTGSAHCALGPYWAGEVGEDEVVGRQVSERGGLVRVTVNEDEVELAGQAVTVLEGELTEAAAP
jgi:PhzF family phenazine biosynthesis protein